MTWAPRNAESSSPGHNPQNSPPGTQPGEFTTKDTKDTRVVQPIPRELDRIARVAVNAAIKVHTALGPGLLESVYEACLAYELEKAGISVQRQVVFPVIYDGVQIDAGLRLDLLLNNQVIIEIKAVEKMMPIFDAQLLTYLKLSGRRLGLLMNFNVTAMRDGIKRIAL